MASTPQEIIAPYDVTELLSELGFSPTCGDEDFPEWLDRYLAVCPDPEGGWFGVTMPDPEAELRLFVMTANGVCRSEAHFDMNSLGHRMFAGAVEALR